MWKQNRFTQIKNLYIYFFSPLFHFSKLFQVNTNKIPPLTLQSVHYKTIIYLTLCLCLKMHLNLFPTVSIAIQSDTVLWLFCDCALWPSYFQTSRALDFSKNKEISVVSLLGQNQSISGLSESWLYFTPDYCLQLKTVDFLLIFSGNRLKSKRKGRRV